MTDNWKFQSPLAVLQQRAFLLSAIRRFFDERGVMEITTPILSSCGNTDINIDVFTTEAITAGDDVAFLRTSPEFFHKRLLASGSGDIFEIAPVFRRGESTPLHNPEFSLLEWYRLDFDLQDLMAEVAELIKTLIVAFGGADLPIKYISYQELMQNFAGLDPFNTSAKELSALCDSHGYTGSPLTCTAALDFLFAVVVEPQLRAAPAQGWMVHHFPVEMAALAQAEPDQPDRCRRFEFLWQGIELANGYQELTDATEQQQRFAQDNLLRQQMGKPAIPVDHHLLAALQAGLPPCSGVAIGVERLLMCLLGKGQLTEVVGFPAASS